MSFGDEFVKDGHCSPEQYKRLKNIKHSRGEKMKKSHLEISYAQAVEYLKKYENVEKNTKSKEKITENEIIKALKKDSTVKVVLVKLFEECKDDVSKIIVDMYEFYMARGFLTTKQIKILRDLFSQNVVIITRLVNDEELESDDFESEIFMGRYR